MSPAGLPHGPHIHARVSVRRTMGMVMMALVPATLFGLYLFGWPAVFLFLVTIASAVVAEALSLRVAGKPVGLFLGDGSALLAGWLVAMTLPPWAPWWIGVLGGFIAIVIGKQIFGGIGQNVFNPAMVARVMLLISFPLEMTTFLDPRPLFSAAAPGFIDSLGITFYSAVDFDAISSASVLGAFKTQAREGMGFGTFVREFFDPVAHLSGYVPGSLGETPGVLIVLGGLFLIWRRIIGWHIPVAMIASMVVLATLFHLVSPDRYPDAAYHVLSGAFLLAAFFIATDYVTAPVTPAGRLLFGAGCGTLVFIIRSWASFPEGVGFAILLMNAATPLLDHYVRPRIFGHGKGG